MRKTTRNRIRNLAACAALAGVAGSAAAIDLRPDSVFVQGGGGPHKVAAAGIGLAWDWNWETLLRRFELTGHTELIANQWWAEDFGNGRQGFRQIVLLPVLRMQLDRGRSPWYLEFGIGASWLDRRYVTPWQDFSTQFNFYDVVGVGYRFGDAHRHELGLRYTHVSNGGIEKPNPGEDFLMLRYGVRF